MSQQTSLFELQTLEILLLISPPENWKKWAREVNKQCLDLFSLPGTLPYVPHISLAEFTFDPSASLKLVASLKQNLSGSGAFEVSPGSLENWSPTLVLKLASNKAMDQILAESDALRKHHGLRKKHFWVSPADNLHLALAKGLNSSQITEIISGICNEVPSENILVKELKILARSGPQEAYRLLEIISLTRS